jgi:hypothetical protein
MNLAEEIEMEKEPKPKPMDLMSISDYNYKEPYRYFFSRKYRPSDEAGHQLLINDLRAEGLLKTAVEYVPT